MRCVLFWALLFHQGAASFLFRQPFLQAKKSSSLFANEPAKTSDVSGVKKTAVLICPAQFCVPADYEDLLICLKKMPELSVTSSSRVAPLPRTEWIKVARNLPTKSFFDATLSVSSTLSWYFDAIECALSEIFASEGSDVNVCIIGHSIGGWVARAYLGGLSGSSSAVYRLAQEQCTSLITLGTPQISPSDALVDQTRGLLQEVERSEACSPQSLLEKGIEITCVCSSSLEGKFLTTNIEQLIAASSYFPLLGKLGNTFGDGIVPIDLAFLDEPARRVNVEKCSMTDSPIRHAHVLPTPWNLYDGYAPSIKLPDEFKWYGSEGVIGEWAKYV
jgi:hypothetical protein